MSGSFTFFCFGALLLKLACDSRIHRYCVGASAIVYVVDAADSEKFELSRSELHDLLSKPSLAGMMDTGSPSASMS